MVPPHPGQAATCHALGSATARAPGAYTPRFEAQLADQPGTVTIDTTYARLFHANGDPLSLGCLSADAAFTVEGDWRDAGQTFAATRIMLRDPQPPPHPQVVRLPANVVAYGVDYHSDGTGMRQPSLLALTSGGMVTPLETLGSLVSHWSAPMPMSGSPYLVLQHQLQSCEQLTWFAFLDTNRGTLTPWVHYPGLTAERMANFLWRPATQDALLFYFAPQTSSGPPQLQYGVLRARPPYQFEYLGKLPSGTGIVAWDAAGGRIVRLQNSRLEWVDPATKVVERVQELEGTIQMLQPTGDGSRLLYLSQAASASRTTADLRMVELATGEEVLLRRGGVAGWQPLFFVPAKGNKGPVVLYEGLFEADGERPPRVRLLAIDPERPDAAQLIVETEGSNYLHAASPCADGRVLYSVEANRGAELRLWHQDGATEVLLEGDDALFPNPWLCR